MSDTCLEQSRKCIPSKKNDIINEFLNVLDYATIIDTFVKQAGALATMNRRVGDL
jgi:hypothetical protein